jgi:Ca2+-binding RTX toxin-like protein
VTKDGNAFGGGTGASVSFTPTDNGSYVVTLTATDKDGGTSDPVSQTIMVANVAPTPTLAGPTIAVSEFAAAFSGSFSDPGTGETYTVAWSFGDGSTAVTTLTPGIASNVPISTSHTYLASGVYTAKVTVSDGRDARTAQCQVVVQSAAVVGGSLLIGGAKTTANIITLAPVAGGYRAVVNANVGTFSPADSGDIIIRGGDAGNVISVSDSVTRGVIVFGGKGIDLIKGGSGNDILVGGDGSDVIAGSAGRDLIIGGNGSDLLVGDAGDDILIAGTTLYDNNITALKAIMAEWSSGRSYNQRVNNLRDGSGSADRLNGNVFLNVGTTAANATVFDDGAVDILVGGAGQDWFIFNNDAGVRDLVMGLTSKEYVDDLDFFNNGLT